MLLQESQSGRRTVTWSCGHGGCDFTVVKDVTDAEPGDDFDLPEIDAHVTEAHRERRYAGVEVRRDDWAPVSLADLALDDGD